MLASNNKLFKINPYKRSYTLLEEINKSDFLCFDVFFNEGPFAIVVLDKNFHVKRLNGRFDYILDLRGVIWSVEIFLSFEYRRCL
ncbi:Uncharacterised protein [Sphingobacterium daejeonense]|nr:Uncharacterised protein [Sphingobacterium daejeonense]